MKNAPAELTAADVSVRYKLYGSIGSPYALKLRSLMRYKRLPFDWMPATLDWIPEDLPHPPLCAASNRKLEGLTPRVVPAVYLPADGSIRNESTTIAYLLDEQHPDRVVVPKDPAVAFCTQLLEDMADEWLVKIAFLYRWGNEEDAACKSRIVTGEFLGGNYSQALLEKAAKHFASRQKSRMPLVGATTENAAMIEMSFRRLLKAMNRLSDKTTFIFGDSPTLADFGFYGQLQSLATDPTSWAVMRRKGLGVLPYLQLLEDPSGAEPAELSLPLVGAATVELLGFAADIYLPYLQANERAVAANEPSFSFEVEGLRYVQAPFKYHAKCYRVLREKFAALEFPARDQVEAALGSSELLSSK
jgi:glutathione S-transferase